MAAAAEIVTIDRARAVAICEKIRGNLTDNRDLALELYEGRGWKAMGYGSWRECVAAEFGAHQSTLYRQLEAALVERELVEDPVFANCEKPSLPDSQLRALADAPKGDRAEVLSIATRAAEGKPTEKVVKAAVAAKRAKPDAPAEDLVEAVKTVVNGEAKADAAVERARAEGRIPAGVVVEVEDPGDEETSVEDVAEAHAERAAKVDEIDDEEWLARLPLHSELEGLSLERFRRDALHYRRLESKRRGVKQANGAAVGELFAGTTWRGHVEAALSWWLRMQQPDRWRKCTAPDKGGCGGTGVVPVYGTECSVCKGKGYIAR